MSTIDTERLLDYIAYCERLLEEGKVSIEEMHVYGYRIKDSQLEFLPPGTPASLIVFASASLSKLDIPDRIRQVLADHGVDTFGKLLGHSESELLRYLGIDHDDVAEIRAALASSGIYLKGEGPDPEGA